MALGSDSAGCVQSPDEVGVGVMSPSTQTLLKIAQDHGRGGRCAEDCWDGQESKRDRKNKNERLLHLHVDVINSYQFGTGG